jgi:hypothetical protein
MAPFQNRPVNASSAVAVNYERHNQDALFALTKASFALFPFRAEKMEYFRFWRVYLSGVEVSDLQEWERGLSTSRLPIAIRRVAFRILTTRRRTCLSFFDLPRKDSSLVLGLYISCAVGFSPIERPGNKQTTHWYSYLVRVYGYSLVPVRVLFCPVSHG